MANADIAERINSVAIAMYTESFTPQRRDQYRPRRGTLIFRLWEDNKLSLSHQRAWKAFADDIHSQAGRSGPVSSGYGESTGGRNPSELRVPVAFENASRQRMQRFWNTCSMGEMRLLGDLIRDEVRPAGLLELDRIGFHRLGYKKSGEAEAAGAATVVALLGRIAAFYGVG